MRNDSLICHRRFDDPMAIPYRTHAHDKWEFLLITQGNARCMIEGSQYAIEENTVIVLKPTQVHRICASGNCPYEYYSLMCNEAVLTEEMLSWMSNHVGIISLKQDHAVCEVLWEINRRSKDTQNIRIPESGYHLIEEMQALLLRAAIGSEPLALTKEDAIVNEAIHYIKDNIHSIVGLDEICEAVGVSRGSLYSRFIRNMLISPMKYVRAKRMSLTQLHICNEQGNMELLRKYGFKNQDSFDREYAYFYRSIP